MQDILLGFKPHNVGDEVPDTSRKPRMAEPDAEEEPEVEKEKEDELDESVNNGSEKFSTLEKNVNGMTHLFAYPDQQGNETRDGLDNWESKDRSNRQLQFVKSKIEATNALKTFNESVNNKINNLITEEQIKIAKLTLSNRNIPTGMSKKEAVQVLMNNNLKKIL